MGGCMEACKNGVLCDEGDGEMLGESDPCQQVCNIACPKLANSDDRECCDLSFCDAGNWCLEKIGMGKRKACYEGDSVCSEVVCAKNF